MRSVLEKISLKIRSVLAPSSVFNFLRMRRDWQIEAFYKRFGWNSQNVGQLPFFELDDGSVYVFKDEKDNSRKDEWVSTARSPCQTSDRYVVVMFVTQALLRYCW